MIIAVNARILLGKRMEGVAKYTFEVLQRMVVDHPEDEFIFLFDRPFDAQFVFADNVTPVILRPVTRHPVLWYLWFEWAIPRALKNYKADVFLSMDTYMSLSTKVPSVLVSHDIAYAHYPSHIPFLVLKYYQRFFPKFHRAAKRLLAVSNFTADDISKTYGIDRSSIKVAYNAIPSTFDTSINVKALEVKAQYTNGCSFFVYLGSLHPRKNIVELIKGYENFRAERGSNHALVLIGRLAWNTADILSAIKDSPYSSDIIHLSNIGKEAKDIVAAAEAMVYVSLFEGFGIPILEAMSLGTPVITSNISSMPEVAGDAALLVDPMDAKAIGRAMNQIASNENLRKDLSKKGLERIKRFDWQETADRVYRACEECLGE